MGVPDPVQQFVILSFQLPGNSEMQLPLSLSTTVDQGMAILEPAPKFIEKHGVLIAHSLTLTAKDLGVNTQSISWTCSDPPK